MSWTEVSSGRWERPLDGVESFYVLMRSIAIPQFDGKEPLKIASKIKFKVNGSVPLEAALKHAWKQLRYEQPGLACIAKDMQKIYEVPDEKALDDWLSETFIESSATSSEELAPSLVPSVPRARLYWLPESSELVLRVPHHQIDGMGVIHLWHSLLSALMSPNANLHFGDEAKRLAPTSPELLGNPPEATAEQKERMQAVFNQWAESVPGIGPKSRLGEAAPGQCQSAGTQFNAALTSRVISACKERGVSVTSALHAAFIGAIERHADPTANKSTYASMGHFDLRRYLPYPYNTSDYAMADYFTIWPFVSTLPASFWDNATALNTWYKTAMTSNPDALALDGTYKKVLFEAFTSPEFLAKPMPKDPMISSLGIVENYLRRSYSSEIFQIEVEDFGMWQDVVLGLATFTIYTFNDMLSLVYNYNDGFQDREDIIAFLDSVKEILLQELMIIG